MLALFPMTGGGTYAARRASEKVLCCRAVKTTQEANAPDNYGDSGSAARFFYCAKSSVRERGESNTHPTVKPIALMEYPCNWPHAPALSCSDLFMGSGTTGYRVPQPRREFIGIERDPSYFDSKPHQT